MRERFHGRLLMLAAGLMAISLVGCGKETTKEVKQSVWSTYNTVKVIQQTDRNDSYEQLEAELSIEMMQNEYEGAQLIVTADKDMTYNLETGELKSENGETIPAEQIAIYHQKYMKIKSNWNGESMYSAGDAIPDMLLPMETAVEYKENTIKAGNNQGITVEVNSENVKAGTYTGTFTLTLGDEKQEIPVCVKVWDFAYEGRRTFQSSFLIYRNQLLSGEYDNSDEMLNNYVDLLMDYKINSYIIRWDNSVENFLKDCKRLFEDPNCNSLIIPYDFPLSYTTYEGETVSPYAEKVLAYIKALAKASTEEKPYIEYAYFYPSTYDEADVIEERIEPSWRFLKEGGELDQTLELAVKQLKEEGWFKKQTPEFAKRVENAILNIPAIFTNVNFTEEWVGKLHAVFCPYISVFEDTATLQQYQESAEDLGNGKLWGYTCYGPLDPYPTFHLDDSARDMRVCGWMEKAYGINGYLYYEVNKYTVAPEQTEDNYVDVYGTAARYEEANGDGFLLYPGKYYGSNRPFASIRLTSYRESMDDYDMLCVYESLLKKYAEKNGIKDFKFNDYVADIYDTLFDGMVAKKDDALVYAARRELASRILQLKEEGTLVVDPNAKEKVNLTQFASGSTKVTIQSECKDAKGEIGSKTKLYRPYYSVKVDEFERADTLYFTYTNKCDIPLSMQITLMTAEGEKVIADTSYCGVGKSKDMRIHFSENLDIDMANVTEIRLTFDNISTDDEGKVTLLPDRAFTLSDMLITTK